MRTIFEVLCDILVPPSAPPPQLNASQMEYKVIVIYFNQGRIVLCADGTWECRLN
jgi:hypothetical protein